MKVSKYGVISGPYFPVFSSNTEKQGPEINPYLDIFHAMRFTKKTYWRMQTNLNRKKKPLTGIINKLTIIPMPDNKQVNTTIPKEHKDDTRV